MLGAAALLLGGCSGQPAAAQAHPSPSAAGAARRPQSVPVGALPAADRSRYIALDLEVAPPDDLGRVVTLPADVENHTGGKVDDVTMKKWAEAEVRESVWETWAVENLQSNFLSHLSPFASEVNEWGVARDWIQAAEDKHAKLSAAFQIDKMVLVPVLPSTQARLQVLGQPPSSYAWILTVSDGRFGAVHLTYPDGHTEELSKIGAGVHRTEMQAGSYKADLAVVGPIWFQESSYTCDGPYERPTCEQ